MAYSVDNEVFRGLALYGGLSLVKVALMSPLSGFLRTSLKSFANVEDARGIGGAKDADELKVMMRPNEHVERVSR